MRIKLFKVLIGILLLSSSVWADRALDERVREIASELRCVVCQNLSVADSPSEMAVQMRGIVREQLEQGKSAEEIKAYFVSKYGEWVLLAPPRSGFNLVVWVLPFVVLAAGLLGAVWILYRWSRKGKTPATESDPDPALLERMHQELAAPDATIAGSDDPESRAKNRIYADLRELEFDYQAGKLSQSDYDALRKRYERQAAALLARAPRREAPAAPDRESAKSSPAVSAPVGRRGWVLAAAAAVLVAGGIAVGLLLGQSVRPRLSSEDSMTGDFLTGTERTSGPTDAELNQLLNAGRIALENRDPRTAIDRFKEVLSADPGNPPANAYMGLILAQAGHTDAALLALDRALARAPRLPVALWAKGMILYRDQRDLDEAKRTFAVLVEMLPPGEERDAVQGMIAEIESGAAGTGEGKPPQDAATLTGVVLLDPKLQTNVDPGAVLFVIARRAGSDRGPPLAVRRIAAPSFPVRFALGAADAMIPGTAFEGPVDIVVRLDTDGNPMTREPGSLTGVYAQNPVAVGTKDLRITLDQVVGE